MESPQRTSGIWKVWRLYGRDRKAWVLARSIPNANGCWIWDGALNANGYGIATGGLAHRIAYEAYVGPIPDGMNVNHRCDVRRCVNPDHLWIGTQIENIADAKAKKRMRGPTDRGGERHPLAKLTATDVWRLRDILSRGVKQKEVAKMFGISSTQVSRIARGTRWAA